jgi:hypothetical protein
MQIICGLLNETECHQTTGGPSGFASFPAGSFFKLWTHFKYSNKHFSQFFSICWNYIVNYWLWLSLLYAGLSPFPSWRLIASSLKSFSNRFLLVTIAEKTRQNSKTVFVLFLFRYLHVMLKEIKYLNRLLLCKQSFFWRWTRLGMNVPLFPLVPFVPRFVPFVRFVPRFFLFCSFCP